METMRTKLINGTVFTEESDYLSFGRHASIHHLLLDHKDGRVVETREMTAAERFSANVELSGEWREWVPALYREEVGE